MMHEINSSLVRRRHCGLAAQTRVKERGVSTELYALNQQLCWHCRLLDCPAYFILPCAFRPQASGGRTPVRSGRSTRLRSGVSQVPSRSVGKPFVVWIHGYRLSFRSAQRYCAEIAQEVSIDAKGSYLIGPARNQCLLKQDVLQISQSTKHLVICSRR